MTKKKYWIVGHYISLLPLPSPNLLESLLDQTIEKMSDEEKLQLIKDLINVKKF